MKDKIFSTLVLLGLIILTSALLFVSCDDDDDDDDDNDNDESLGGSDVLVGWVVGEPGEANGTAAASVSLTTDGGATWLLKSDGISAVSIYDVSAPSNTHAWIVGEKDDQGYATIYHTSNSGEKWERQGDATQFKNVALLGVHAVDESHVWIVGHNYSSGGAVIAHSKNAGTTWDVWSSELPADNTLFKVDAVDDQTVWIIGDVDSNGYGIILFTTDGGESWNRVGSADFDPFGLIDLSVVDAQTVWIVGVNDTIIRTLDGGQNWDSWDLVGSYLHVNGVCAFSADNAWIAVDYGQIYYTEDGGEHWNDASPTGEVHGYHLIGICSGDGQSVWAAGIHANYPRDGKIYYTADKGENWVEQPLPITGSGLAYFSFPSGCK